MASDDVSFTATILNTDLLSALERDDWYKAPRLLRDAGVSDSDRELVIREAWKRAPECTLCDFVDLCRDDEVEQMLTEVVKRELWGPAIKRLLNRGVSQEMQKWAVDQAIASISTSEYFSSDVVLDLLPFFKADQSVTLLQTAVGRGLWDVVGGVLKGGVTDTQRKWAVEEAVKRVHAGEAHELESHVLPYCDVDQIDSVLHTVVERGLWNIVGSVLERGATDTLRRWAVEEAVKRIDIKDTYELKSYILPYCDAGQTDSVLQIALGRGLWSVVGKVLEGDVTDTQRRWAVEEAVKRVSAEDAYELCSDILRKCDEDQISGLLETAVERNLWGVAEYFLDNRSHLSRQSSSCAGSKCRVNPEQKKWVVDQAIARASEAKDGSLRGILLLCDDKQVNSALSVAIDNDFWYTVEQLLKRGAMPSLRQKAVFAWIERNQDDWNDYRRCEILDYCPEDFYENAIKTSVSLDKWRTAVCLMKHPVDDSLRRWVLREASERASEEKLRFVILYDIPSSCTHFDVMLPGLAARKLWNLVAACVERGVRHFEKDSFDLCLNLSANGRQWNIVYRLIKHGVGFDHYCVGRTVHSVPSCSALHGWAVEEASKAGTDSDFHVENIVSLCPDEYVDSVFQTLVERGLWKHASKLLGRNISHESLKEAVLKVSTEDTLLLHNFVQVCPEEILDTVFSRLIKRDAWDSVGVMLSRNINESLRQQGLLKACKTAGTWDMEHYIIGNCPNDCLETVCRSLVQRKMWGCLGKALSRGVTNAAEFVQDACKTASKQKLLESVLAHCPTDCLDPACRILVERKLWKALGLVLSNRAQQVGNLGWVLAEASKVAPEEQLLQRNILQHCPDEDHDSVLMIVVGRKMWRAAGKLLTGSVSYTYRLQAVEEALKFIGSRKKKGEKLRQYMKVIIFNHTPDLFDRMMADIIETQSWDYFQHMILLSGKFQPRKTHKHGEDLCRIAGHNNMTLLHAACVSGLRRTMAKLVENGADPLAVNHQGSTLLSLAVRAEHDPVALVSECIRLGVSTHQTELVPDVNTSDTNVPSRGPARGSRRRRNRGAVAETHCRFPFRCALERESTILMKMLYESGAVSNRHLHELLQTLHIEISEEQLNETFRNQTGYLDELVSTPRTLKSLCRLVVSHHLGVHWGREERSAQLRLPDQLRSYVLFSDLCDPDSAGWEESMESSRLSNTESTEAELQDMMREMLPEFLKKVDPREDGFLDTLYASLLLTDTDNESLSGKDVLTRKDQARKLWFILSKVPLDDFISKVAPELCSKYPHIIPSRFRCYNGQDVIELEQVKGDNSSDKCLRCAIQDRIRATSMADMLYSMNFLDFEDYGDVISSKFEKEAVWMALFSAFCERTESEIDALMEGLRELLKRYSICTPPVLKDVLTAGFPCTCDEPMSIPPTASSVPVNKVNKMGISKMQNKDLVGNMLKLLSKHDDCEEEGL